MGFTRDSISEVLYHGTDPFIGFEALPDWIDQQGWASNHPYLCSAIQTLPVSALIVEVGVWKGGSVITMGKECKRLSLDAAIVAVDTWLGSHEHWVDASLFESLKIKCARPRLQKTFMTNIINNRLTDYVIPLPLDSINACRVISDLGLRCNLLHIDAGHDYRSVSSDLQCWWDLLCPGGVMLCDDYFDGGVWPEVRAAVDDFVVKQNLSIRSYQDGKCWIDKPLQPSQA